jgi:predicted nuclease of predicted toxin-antitoxin system
LIEWWREIFDRRATSKARALELIECGHEAIHTRELQRGNRTQDNEIAEVAAEEGRVVVTKDGDFVASFLLFRKPPKLLLVSTGNMSNDVLLRLFRSNLAALEAAFAGHDFVELNSSAITIHM